MKESYLYLNFLKTFGLLFVLLAIIGLIMSYYFVNKLPDIYISERLYGFNYKLENAAAVEKESEQVVTVLRSKNLIEELRINESQVNIYKPGPFAVAIQVKSQNAELAVSNLMTLSGYVESKYQVEQIGKEVFSTEPKPYFKYMFSGFIVGELTALFVSLAISYFKRY